MLESTIAIDKCVMTKRSVCVRMKRKDIEEHHCENHFQQYIIAGAY